MPMSRPRAGRARPRYPGAVLALALALLPLLAACVPGDPVAPAAPAPLAAWSGNGDPPLLVDAGWLRARRGVPAEAGPLLVLDLSAPRTYRRGHVPGAVHAWWQDAVDPHYAVYGAVLKPGDDPTQDRIAALLAEWGVGDTTQVVAYDDERNRHAAKVVWFLRSLGHERAAVLDGGLAGWRGAGGAVSEDGADAPSAPPATIRGGQEWAARWVIGTTELRDRLAAGDPSLVLLDARTPEEAEDDLDGRLRRGTIPGAVRLPWDSLVRDEHGRLGSPDELAALLRDAGVTPDREVVVFARFGTETGPPWLALALLGYPKVRVYDQSWAEWAQGDRADLPVAAG